MLLNQCPRNQGKSSKGAPLKPSAPSQGASTLLAV
jgi:hypothetical protein